MCIHDFLDMYALSPWALGIHIRQIPHAHDTTITYKSLLYFSHVSYSYINVGYFCYCTSPRQNQGQVLTKILQLLWLISDLRLQ